MYIFVLGWLAIGFAACDQDVDYPYTGKDRIQFKHFTTDYNGKRTYSDSLVFSLGLRPDSITIDTAKIVMQYLGKGSQSTRTYHVLILPDSTTAIAGTHFALIDKEQTFRPHSLTDTLRIAIYRENLSTSFRNPQTIRIDLQLEASDDFDLGLGGGLYKKVLLNNYLSEPDWWEGNFHGSLGFYHPEKWKILISFNQQFANTTECPFDYNNEGRTYYQGLNSYLTNVPTFDEETGDRIYMNEMVPQN